MTATGLTPGSISIAPTSFAFADTLVGATSASHSFTVTNGGGAPIGTGTALSVALSGANAADFSISSTTCTGTLAAAASCTVAVVFKPTAAGARTAGLTAGAAPGGNASASLSGTGLSQAGLTLAAASGSSNNFGTVATNSSATETLTVTNTGQGASSAILVSLSGADYALVAPAGGDCVNAATLLAGGTSCTIRVQFTPSTTGTRSASLSANAATGGTPPALSLTGIGKLPTGTIFEYPTLPPDPDGAPTTLAVGADGAIYFGGSAMGRMTLAGTFSVLGNPSDGVWFVVAAPDNNLWYTNFSGSISSAVVGRMSTTGTTNEFTFTGGREGENIAVGPDNNIWVSEPNSNLVLRVSTNGALLNQYTVPFAAELAAGPDGNVWVVDFFGSQIYRIVIASGAVTEYPVGDGPNAISAGPDGNLWVLENTANKIGKFSTTSLTLLAEYPASANANLNSIISGPDGNLWFTEPGISKVGRITPAGAIVDYATPTAGSGPLGITAGPDGNLYFVETTPRRIARISP
ncbi:MAG TPA: choice-of-anchor D domain-containing protein [Polyangia bacterium]|nr:choice-of-anchor D domain-containing protein [Polyangia bacterium]